MPPFTGTLNTSILVQDVAAPTAPVTKVTEAKTDQLTNQPEYFELSVTVPASAVDQVVNLTGFDPQMIQILTDNPVTMKRDAGTEAQPIRSIYVATFSAGEGPASMKLTNPSGTLDAQVRIAGTSVN
jgi:hypothetical protein